MGVTSFGKGGGGREGVKRGDVVWGGGRETVRGCDGDCGGAGGGGEEGEKRGGK